MQLQRTVRTTASPDVVFDYLSDFTTTTEWDPGTVSTVLLSGDGGVGTTYRNVSSFLGRESELTYTVVERIAPTRFALRGENKTVVAHDTMEVHPEGAGTRVTYTADFTFKGVAKYLAPLLRPALTRLGDHAEEGLAAALGKLA
ncbi:SRPBCC family protein [Nocardioides sp. LS1]|uniref:SRPBCC family protein n=1 Tax=Nocardioides sp. LS1 TaxID=1027620 RepID=UPI000F627D4A|nr:SRPBCC family protein [Nocardioides sp. LS1]GCD90282.1 polyketide cyclase [Nocardioides sp. LS1]